MKAFQKIATLFLSLIVLLSSMSFTLNRHLCMGEIEKVSLFKEVKACKMHAKSCHDDKSESSKKDCCENEQLIVQGQDELTKASIFKQPQPEMSAVLYLLVAYFTVNTVQPDVVPHQHYAPPLIRQDIPVLIQSFLI
ncbi:hypothetical protein [Cyclobacterium sp.]|uniref:HYC_CC_PP family protein n=1 Tax=Cyclobacterium sp. TaxID=1966343 RepID=UPI0019B0D461|nr:hypothetical protein [Cyclobacterium sp.]MBD3626524.1 hypothetical protein [Cyclobacterium sp.]